MSKYGFSFIHAYDDMILDVYNPETELKEMINNKRDGLFF